MKIMSNYKPTKIPRNTRTLKKGDKVRFTKYAKAILMLKNRKEVFTITEYLPHTYCVFFLPRNRREYHHQSYFELVKQNE